MGGNRALDGEEPGAGTGSEGSLDDLRGLMQRDGRMALCFKRRIAVSYL